MRRRHRPTRARTARDPRAPQRRVRRHVVRQPQLVHPEALRRFGDLGGGPRVRREVRIAPLVHPHPSADDGRPGPDPGSARPARHRPRSAGRPAARADLSSWRLPPAALWYGPWPPQPGRAPATTRPYPTVSNGLPRASTATTDRGADSLCGTTHGHRSPAVPLARDQPSPHGDDTPSTRACRPPQLPHSRPRDLAVCDIRGGCSEGDDDHERTQTRTARNTARTRPRPTTPRNGPAAIPASAGASAESPPGPPPPVTAATASSPPSPPPCRCAATPSPAPPHAATRPPTLHPLVQDFLDALASAQRDRFTGTLRRDHAPLPPHRRRRRRPQQDAPPARPMTNGEARRALKHGQAHRAPHPRGRRPAARQPTPPPAAPAPPSAPTSAYASSTPANGG